ncbi:MAG: glycosyltransferase family 39 protein [Neorhizobium sp.]|nr:glycosyltransferase family 39 protein [Neorhizobium sp.]
MTQKTLAMTPKGVTIRRPATVLLVLALYFIVNIGVRYIIPHGLELDEAEQTYFSQWMLTGYSSQPPFYNWLQYGVIHLFGTSLLSLTALKNVMLFSTYLFYWLAAREALGEKRLAVVAALSLLTIPQVAFEAQRDLSHTVAAMFGTAFFLFAFLRVVNRASVGTFLLLGIAIGIGGLTKYNFAIIPIAALLAVAVDRDLRSRLFDWRIVISIVVALAILSPHLSWLVENGQSASSHTMRKMLGNDTNILIGIVQGLGSLAMAVIAFLALTIVVLAAVFRENLGQILKASNPKTRLIGRILVICIGAIVLMILFGGVERVRDRWLTPILLIAPLYLAIKVDASRIDAGRGIRRLWGVAAVIMVLIPVALLGRALQGHYLGKYNYPNIPFPNLARTITPMAMQPGTIIIASDGHLGGNMRFNLPNVPVQLLRPPTGLVPTPLSHYRRAVFVWRNSDSSPPKTFEETFGNYLKRNGLSAENASTAIAGFPYLWGSPTDQSLFGYAVMDLPQN